MTAPPIVLVTGASKGIGAATAKAFAKAGYDVFINYRDDGTGARKTVEACETFGVRAFAFQADISDRQATAKMFAACDRALGSISCLINNAGVIGGATYLSDLKTAALEATFETNVYGAIYCLQEALGRMRTDQGGAGGTIVNMSSVAATLGSPGEYVHYAASKGALETLTIGAAKELGPLGVRVAAIRAGTRTSLPIRPASGAPPSCNA